MERQINWKDFKLHFRPNQPRGFVFLFIYLFIIFFLLLLSFADTFQNQRFQKLNIGILAFQGPELQCLLKVKQDLS